MIEINTAEYRTIRNDIVEMEEALAALNLRRAEIEKAVFLNLNIGESYVAEEFRFEVKEGRRSLSPRSGFERDWEALISVCTDPALGERMQKMVKKQTVFKGPTLGELEKELLNNAFLREQYDRAKAILGYNDGGRRESVTITEKVPENADSVVPGRFCFSKVAGTSFRNLTDKDWASIHNGDPLVLEREPDNQYDRNAIKVMVDGLHLGYIKGDLAEKIAPLMDAGTKFSARVSEVTGGGAKANGCNIEIIVEV